MFRILNLEQARFECTYGRGCEGICCREGRPLVYAEEAEQIDRHLAEFLPLLRPQARQAIGRRGYLRLRRRLGQQVMRGAGGWCVFYNQGCVLHRAGQQAGDPFRYKPAVCALFPIQTDQRDRWYVRQKGYQRERWNLFCLDPQSTAVPAATSLAREIALALHFDGSGASE